MLRRVGRDHPRVCGEHDCGEHFDVSFLGSSPRMRGTPTSGRRPSPKAGIIPAYAGNTQHVWDTDTAWQDHPRVCGEHFPSALSELRTPGSSPRMRGTRRPAMRRGCVPGIIPAYAGNTSSKRCPAESARDHPRVCGEHLSERTEKFDGRGSSPRMRGTRAMNHGRVAAFGIIPAYAGNTGLNDSLRGIAGDHPRVCGEHHATGREHVQVAGSSPRMRGTHIHCRRIGWATGIIPAYAGNTDSLAGVGVVRWDHPRVCGEHFHSRIVMSTALGSSPRMRGTRVDNNRYSVICGIIPAYAGNTRTVTWTMILRRDHPRVCGEHVSMRLAI